ncbi:hypothetical protein BJV85_003881 [Clostridium acetobutylicum]|uniref:Inner membrane protein YgaP-like transmembrane domain-containing protein n=2 Tax=Clostridiaceae TaxID=31979 RepID=Q97TQ9_CLOAB|nr:YgaP-like transmembrane domain [Clostridium acetobutylicum]ADZ22821.1 Conserved hypothetical protein [Clostridium acetobutylicum EA 2018]PSM04367.1 DUF2892 domain-containing protein [Clostridium sp. NJ4]AAK76785.1 Hypothetical protein CA_P0039 [Clostridium acetobutylicum ATCC 824]AEI34781.1 hypothetical protein SMB_P038 [Clostridium acetobutylicum DSM 1731]AWV82330.1 DUF2892 domain-containing protein [Clostridium acetobutylicum]
MLHTICPPTSKRVAMNTSNEINLKIQKKLCSNIEAYNKMSKEEILSKIHELDAEWDIERILETNAASIILLSIAAGLIKKNSGYFKFAGIVSGFLLQHAIHGWCPPLPLLRKMGIRTQEEIDEEKFHLKRLWEKKFDKL